MNNILTFRIGLTLLIFMMFGSQYGAAQSFSSEPLFASNEVIKLRIEAPLKSLISKAKRSTDPYPGQLTVLDGSSQVYDITVAARGKSRRERYCRFPPLRVKFDKKSRMSGVFAGQKSLKLVTHCGKSDKYQQYALVEYSAYRMFNQITPKSLNTRLVHIDYVDTKSGKTIASRYGFFIEDMDDAAKRNGMKEIDVPRVGSQQLNADAAARVVLFQYMIGNLDWSIKKGPPGADCCHNGKIMGATKTSRQNLFVTPYDFDNSGLVNASYAEAPESLPVRSVRDRYYRGFCTQNANVQALFGEFAQKRSAISGTLDNIPPLDNKYREKARSYLDGFFETINDPNAAQKRLMSKCR